MGTIQLQPALNIQCEKREILMSSPSSHFVQLKEEEGKLRCIYEVHSPGV